MGYVQVDATFAGPRGTERCGARVRNALVDTGAGRTVVPPDLAARLESSRDFTGGLFPTGPQGSAVTSVYTLMHEHPDDRTLLRVFSSPELAVAYRDTLSWWLRQTSGVWGWRLDDPAADPEVVAPPLKRWRELAREIAHRPDL